MLKLTEIPEWMRLKRAVLNLGLELPGPVHDDVVRTFNDAATALAGAASTLGGGAAAELAGSIESLMDEAIERPWGVHFDEDWDKWQLIRLDDSAQHEEGQDMSFARFDDKATAYWVLSLANAAETIVSSLRATPTPAAALVGGEAAIASEKKEVTEFVIQYKPTGTANWHPKLNADEKSNATLEQAVKRLAVVQKGWPNNDYRIIKTVTCITVDSWQAEVPAAPTQTGKEQDANG